MSHYRLGGRVSGFDRKVMAGVAGALISTSVLLWSYRVYILYLGYDTYGLWLLVTTVITLLQIGNVGVCPAVAKLVAEELAGGHLDNARTHIRTAVIAVAACSLGLAVIAVVAMPWVVQSLAIAQSGRDLVNGLVPWVAVLSIYAITVDTFASTLSGAGRIDLLHWCQAGATTTTALVSVWWLHLGAGAYALLAGQAAGYVF